MMVLSHSDEVLISWNWNLNSEFEKFEFDNAVGLAVVFEWTIFRPVCQP